MVKPENFKIAFQEEQTVFYAGQVVEGQVNFKFLRPERAKALTLIFTGVESVYSGPIGTKRSVEDNEIFKVKRILWDNPCGYFEAKAYTFPFKIDLGAYNFPSSYEGEMASIRYKVKAVIDRPSRFGHTTTLPVTVLSSIPNFVPELIKPETFQTSAIYGTFHRESIGVVVDTKFRSCTPGGNLILDISLTPRNTKSVTGMSIKLVQTVKVNSPLRTQTQENEISIMDVPIQMFDDEDSDLLKISVPPTTPPNITTSNFLSIYYHLSISTAVAWSYTPLTITIPIQLATLNVTMEELPPLLNGPQYLPPYIDGGEFLTKDLPSNPRHSMTPSLISDVSSLFTNDSDDLNESKRVIPLPNYSPSRSDDNSKILSNADLTDLPTSILS